MLSARISSATAAGLLFLSSFAIAQAPAAPPAVSPTAPTAPATPATVAAPAAAPGVIDVFGDSLADGLWAGMYAVLRKHPEVKLYRHSKVGTGLTTPSFPDWIKEFTADLDADHPTTVLIMFGANDEQSVRDENHKGYVFKSAGWTAVYNGRIDAILAETAKRHVQTIWVGLPIMRADDMNTGARYLDDQFETASKHQNITFVPLIDTFKGPDGAFATHLPDAAGKLHLVRADDGVHFTPYGYELIAEKVYPLITPPAAPHPAS